MQCNTIHSAALLVFLILASAAGRADDSGPIGPVLTGITLSGFTGRLNPAFDPDVTRYSIVSLSLIHI